MSWYNPINWLQSGASFIANHGGHSAAGHVEDASNNIRNDASGFLDSPSDADEAARKRNLYAQASQAGDFAGQSQYGYGVYGGLGMDALDRFRSQMNGTDSPSSYQLRQGLAQNLAAQQAQVASASPQNSAMAARTGAIQSARLGAGMAGQQALAGVQERNAAAQQYGSLLTGLRGQDLQASLGSRQNALTGYGANNAGAPAQSDFQKLLPAITAGAALASDKRLKTNVEDGSKAADSALKGLRAHLYEYRDSSLGQGKRVGVLAQDLEKAGLGHTIINTRGGKAVHSGHLAAALAAMMPGLDKRLERLERKGKA